MQGQALTAPVIQPRGVMNAYTQLPAPAVAGQGGLIHINGINLASPEGWKAEGLLLPTQFGEPPVQVLINNQPAALLSATPGRIVAQIPLETPNGLVGVVVRRGYQQSRVARLQVQALAPGLLAASGLGFGAAANAGTDGILKLKATSLGMTEPRAGTGEAATEATAPQAVLNAYVGGVQAVMSASYSSTTPGEFDIELKVPEGAKDGDAILLVANASEANLLTMNKGRRESEALYIPYPAGTPDLRSVRSSDVNGLFLNANGVRGTDTCFQSFLIDALKKTFEKIDGCLTTAQPQAITPFIDSAGSPVFAAFVGPFTGTVQAGQPTLVSDKVKLFRALPAEPVQATLPVAVAALNGTVGGNFIATAPGSAGTPGKSYSIHSGTGEVAETAAVGVIGVVAPAGGTNLQALLQRFSAIDLGDGINKLLSQVSVLNNQFVLTVGDSLEKPTKAKVAVLSGQGHIVSQRALPGGWLPMVAPAAAQQPLPGGGQIPPGVAQLRAPTPIYMDAQTRNYYVAVRSSEGKHGLAYFPAEGDAQVILLPEDWYFTGCVPNIAVYGIELARGIAMLGGKSEENSFKNPCPADGFLLFDLTARRFAAVGLPGAGKFNASGGADELNDFLTGSNIDPANRNTSDTFYVLDGVNATAFRFDLPAGVNYFSGGTRIPALNLVVAQANNRVPGDAGLVLFDLERTEARLLPTPEGFVSMNYLGLLPSIRRVVARGIKTGNSGSQMLVYNLENGDLEVIVNPEGVAFIGSPPQQQPVPGQQPVVNLPVRVNQKANTVEAIVFGEDRRQRGVVVIRVN